MFDVRGCGVIAHPLLPRATEKIPGLTNGDPIAIGLLCKAGYHYKTNNSLPAGKDGV